jgi:hypothetical protein
MNTRMLAWIAAGFFALLPAAAAADQQNLQFGGDSYAAGDAVTLTQPSPHGAFLAGRDVTLSAPVGANAHLAGMNVRSTTDIGGSLYAAGFSVTIGGTVKGDVTAAGNSIALTTTAPLPGNARLMGQNITIDSEVDGALLVLGQSATLNQAVKGDLSFYGQSLTFGPAARVDGKVLIHAPKSIQVPTTVATADRVAFTQTASGQAPADVARNAASALAGFGLWAAAVWWLLLFLVGLAFIAFGPGLVGRYEALSGLRPLRRIGLGILAFAALIGLIPVLALTLIGLLLVPVVLLIAVIGWALAYLAGAYLVGYHLTSRVAAVDSRPRRIGVLAISLVLAGLLAMIPFLGWLISLVFVVFGFGVIAALIMTRWSDADRMRIAGPTTPAPI